MNNLLKPLVLCCAYFTLCLPLAAEEPAVASTDTPRTSAASPADSLKEQAAALLGQGKPQEAYDLLKARREAGDADAETAFLLGQCALELNRPAEAAVLYEEILAKEKNLPRVQLELGRAYAALGEVQKAKEQFNQVLAGSPPPRVGENVNKFVASLESQRHWNARASAGYLYDSNVNAGPTAGTVLMFGVPFQLSGDSRETSAYGYTAGLQAGYFRKLKGNLALQADAGYNRARYAAKHAFDSDVMSGSAGPTLQKKSLIVSLPLLFENVRIGHDRYNYAFGLSPQIMLPLTERLAANSSLVFQRKRYYVGDGIRNGGFWAASAGAKYFYRQDGFVQVSYRHARETTKADYLDNRSDALNLGWYSGLPRGYSLYLAPGLSQTAYDEREAAYDERRKDTQYSAVVNLSREFATPGLSGTLGYTFTRNNSNLGLYDYRRTQLSAQVSLAF